MIPNIPIYRATIPDEECGMFRVSLVDDPAVDSLFLAFDAQKRVPMFAIADEEKRLVRGVIMRANYPIYRFSPTMGEYYIVFTPEIIRLMAEKYLVEGRQNAVNVMHIDGSDVEGVDMVQMFIKDSAAGIAPANFEDIEDGSLFGEYHVLNDQVWADIKAGTYKGFSLEGLFDLEKQPSQLSKQNTEMTAREKLRKLMTELLALTEKFGQVTTDKGVLRWDGEEDLRSGFTVVHVAENGDEKRPEDGDYTTEDGKVIKVVDGKVAEISDPKAEVEGAKGDPDPNGNPADPNPHREAIEEIRKRLDSIDERIGIIEKKLDENDIRMSKTEEKMETIKKEPASKSVKTRMSSIPTEGRMGKLAENLNL